MIFDINNELIRKYMFSATFGMEKESLRIDNNGNLAKTPHPFTDKHFERDFSENQLEIITDVFDNTEKTYNHLYSLQKQAIKKLKDLKTGSEYLWCFSNPPYVTGDDIQIANYTDDRLQYRKYLAKKYGKKKMLFSGVHYNFSFGDDLLKIAFEVSDYIDFKEFKNSVYLELAEKLLEYSHIIVFLTSASPVADKSFYDEDVAKQYTSLRCSEHGYWNNFTPILDYNSLDSYIKSVEKYIDNGELLSIKELYYPVRLKPIGDNTLQNLQQNGINHIELRMLDINPLSVAGFMKEDMDFLHLLLIYLMFLQYKPVNQKKAIDKLKKSTLFECFDELKKETIYLLDSMEKFFECYQVNDILKYQKDKILQEKLYSEIIKQQFGNDYVKNGIILSKRYAKMLED